MIIYVFYQCNDLWRSNKIYHKYFIFHKYINVIRSTIHRINHESFFMKKKNISLRNLIRQVF
ncbi:unnamed protein product [Schistosoma curassoni]|uniref:Uncharacterized protein n=1 Tax=Schistosoma curassoni TaxID=6186 RepID=A0A183KJM3_9TREM|nr:unnamed protein product [Schistosoma curassoni]